VAEREREKLRIVARRASAAKAGAADATAAARIKIALKGRKIASSPTVQTMYHSAIVERGLCLREPPQAHARQSVVLTLIRTSPNISRR